MLYYFNRLIGLIDFTATLVKGTDISTFQSYYVGAYSRITRLNSSAYDHYVECL